jgi:hypothetical protein
MLLILLFLQTVCYIVVTRTTQHRKNTASARPYRKHLPTSLILLCDVTEHALHSNGPCADQRKHCSSIDGRVCVAGVA